MTAIQDKTFTGVDRVLTRLQHRVRQGELRAFTYEVNTTTVTETDDHKITVVNKGAHLSPTTTLQEGLRYFIETPHWGRYFLHEHYRFPRASLCPA